MPTTDAVPSSAAEDLVFNAQRLDEALTGAAPTYVDRLGVQRMTVAGAVARISAINSRGAWATATAYQARDVVQSSGTWYLALDAHTSGASFAGDQAAHWRVYQGVVSTDLSSVATAADGAGMIASDFELNYVAGTIGNDMRYAGIPSIFRVLSEAQQQDVLTYGFTLDLYATIAAAYALCKTWHFPAGGYKITDEIAAMTGMRAIGAGHGDRYYGAQPTTATPTRFWQATAGKAVFKIGVGVSDVVISDMCMAPVQTPAAYTAYTANTFGIRMIGAAYVAAGTVTQQAGRSSYRISLHRLTGYQFEKFVSCEDYYWSTTGLTPPNSGADWQCDAVDVLQCHGFSSLHHIYLNTLNADAWTITNCNTIVWTGGSGLYLQRAGYVKADTCYWVPAETAASVIATNTTGVVWGDYPDTTTLLNCSGADSLTYFLDALPPNGYDNVYFTINLEGCIVEAPIRLRRSCKLVSKASRSTEDWTCSGDDIEVHSIGDSWSPTTKKILMTGARPRFFPSRGSSLCSGTVSAPTATATTLATFPASQGQYSVSVWIAAGGSTYHAVHFFGCDGTTLSPIGGHAGAGISLSVSGRDVKVTHTSGVTATVSYSWQREA